MQMIDVLKRLAELDKSKPRAERGMTVEKSLATVTNINGGLNECGPMGMGGGTPASISVTAGSGEEVSSMLRDIMSLAGINKAPDTGEVPVAQPSPTTDHGNGEMSDMISMVDKMNGPQDGGEQEDESLGGEVLGGIAGEILAPEIPGSGVVGAKIGDKVSDMMGGGDEDEQDESIGGWVKGAAGAAALGAAAAGGAGAMHSHDQGQIDRYGAQSAGDRGIPHIEDEPLDKKWEDPNPDNRPMFDNTREDQTDPTYDNSPHEKIEPHDYGDKEVKPKPQGFKQRIGDNPYMNPQESLEVRLRREWQGFVTEAKAPPAKEKGKADPKKPAGKEAARNTTKSKSAVSAKNSPNVSAPKNTKKPKHGSPEWAEDLVGRMKKQWNENQKLKAENKKLKEFAGSADEFGGDFGGAGGSFKDDPRYKREQELSAQNDAQYWASQEGRERTRAENRYAKMKRAKITKRGRVSTEYTLADGTMIATSWNPGLRGNDRLQPLGQVQPGWEDDLANQDYSHWGEGVTKKKKTLESRQLTEDEVDDARKQAELDYGKALAEINPHPNGASPSVALHRSGDYSFWHLDSVKGTFRGKWTQVGERRYQFTDIVHDKNTPNHFLGGGQQSSPPPASPPSHSTPAPGGQHVGPDGGRQHFVSMQAESKRRGQ